MYRSFKSVNDRDDLKLVELVSVTENEIKIKIKLQAFHATFLLILLIVC